MEFSEVVRRRRMRRSYRPDPVPRAVLERVLELAVRHPSAGFAQGVSFVVVTADDTRRALAELAGEPEYVARGFEPWLTAAPVHVLLATSEEAYHRRYAEADKGGSSRDWEVPYWHVDAGAALQLLLLAAVDAGLAAGFLGAHRLKGAGQLLGLPADVTPVGLVTLGYAGGGDRPSRSHERGRQPTVHWEKWLPPGGGRGGV